MGQPLFAGDLFSDSNILRARSPRINLRHFPAAPPNARHATANRPYGAWQRTPACCDRRSSMIIYIHWESNRSSFPDLEPISTGTPEETSLVHWMAVAAEKAKARRVHRWIPTPWTTLQGLNDRRETDRCGFPMALIP